MRSRTVNICNKETQFFGKPGFGIIPEKMVLGLGLQVGEKGNSGDQLAVVTLVPASQSVILSQSISTSITINQY
jgi:hypothetical protein